MYFWTRVWWLWKLSAFILPWSMTVIIKPWAQLKILQFFIFFSCPKLPGWNLRGLCFLWHRNSRWGCFSRWKWRCWRSNICRRLIWNLTYCYGSTTSAAITARTATNTTGACTILSERYNASIQGGWLRYRSCFYPKCQVQLGVILSSRPWRFARRSSRTVTRTLFVNYELN